VNNVLQPIWNFLNKLIFKRKEGMIKLIIDDLGYTLIINGKEYKSPCQVNIPLVKLNDVVRYLRAKGISKYKFISDTEQPRPVKRVISRKEEPNKPEEINQYYNEPKTNLIYKTDPNISEKLDRLEELIKKISEKDPVIIQQITSTENGKNIIKSKDNEDTFIPSVNTSDLKLKVSGSKILENEKTDTSAVDALSKLSKKNK